MAFRPIIAYSWPAMAVLAVVLSSARPASADSFTGYCVYSRGFEICGQRWGENGNGFPRVIQVPAPRPENAGETEARERKWLARCRPVVKQDGYGIGRYHYAAPGCEFGKSED